MTIHPGKTYIGKVRLREYYYPRAIREALDGFEAEFIAHHQIKWPHHDAGVWLMVNQKRDLALRQQDFEWLREKVE